MTTAIFLMPHVLVESHHIHLVSLFLSSSAPVTSMTNKIQRKWFYVTFKASSIIGQFPKGAFFRGDSDWGNQPLCNEENTVAYIEGPHGQVNVEKNWGPITNSKYQLPHRWVSNPSNDFSIQPPHPPAEPQVSRNREKLYSLSKSLIHECNKWLFYTTKSWDNFYVIIVTKAETRIQVLHL